MQSFEVEHRPVYGSNEKDEFICSCGWSGPTLDVARHFERAQHDAGRRIVTFLDLIDDDSRSDFWDKLNALEGRDGYLSPQQFVAAMRNVGFKTRRPPEV
jgi:hypothetical protein